MYSCADLHRTGQRAVKVETAIGLWLCALHCVYFHKTHFFTTLCEDPARKGRFIHIGRDVESIGRKPIMLFLICP
jgi:hypothetical protein